MSSVLEKSLAIVELLVEHPLGLPISAIAEQTSQPVSGVHRTLHELIRLGYVRQLQGGGDYAISMKLPAMGLGFLGRTGVTDVAQPILDSLAARSGELVRLSVIDGARLIWVAVAQGATTGLRYDPGQEQGVVVHLASSAGGRAWLAALSDDEALALVGAQGLHRPAGPPQATSFSELFALLGETRTRGYSVAVDSYIPGMAAMAMAVRYRGAGPVLGCLSIAGPAVRMTPARMAELAPGLAEAAAELGRAAAGSQYFHATMKAMDGPPERRTA